MPNPYRKVLEEMVSHEGPSMSWEVVVIQRADAPDLKGKVVEVDDDGVTIAYTDPEDAEYRRNMFIAHRDIRGVETEGGLNYDMVG